MGAFAPARGWGRTPPPEGRQPALFAILPSIERLFRPALPATDQTAAASSKFVTDRLTADSIVSARYSDV